MRQKQMMYQWMVSGARRLLAVGQCGGSVRMLAVVLLLPLGRGDLDTTFGGTGKVLTDFKGGQDETAALAIQPDGKLVVAGYSIAAGGSSFDFALARYLPNGALEHRSSIFP